jgi:hypothetical protein
VAGQGGLSRRQHLGEGSGRARGRADWKTARRRRRLELRRGWGGEPAPAPARLLHLAWLTCAAAGDGPPAAVAAEADRVGSALTKAFEAIDREILTRCRLNGTRGGATAVVVMRIGEKSPARTCRGALPVRSCQLGLRRPGSRLAPPSTRGRAGRLPGSPRPLGTHPNPHSRPLPPPP